MGPFDGGTRAGGSCADAGVAARWALPALTTFSLVDLHTRASRSRPPQNMFGGSYSDAELSDDEDWIPRTFLNEDVKVRVTPVPSA